MGGVEGSLTSASVDFGCHSSDISCVLACLIVIRLASRLRSPRKPIAFASQAGRVRLARWSCSPPRPVAFASQAGRVHLAGRSCSPRKLVVFLIAVTASSSSPAPALTVIQSVQWMMISGICTAVRRVD